MVLSTTTETYDHMLAYAEHKAKLRLDKLILQAFGAGFWVAIVGHCCTSIAAAFYNEVSVYSSGLTRLIYGLTFPAAFMAVSYTGTELYTGNTVAMLLLTLDRGYKKISVLLKVWGVSILGNCAGAVFTGFLISYCSGVFTDAGSQNQKFLFSMAEHKVSYEFGQAMVLGIACNCLVCLCTWGILMSSDGIGKITCMLYSIGTFAIGGCEHIVANFYTISLAYMCGFKAKPFGTAFVFNWIAV